MDYFTTLSEKPLYTAKNIDLALQVSSSTERGFTKNKISSSDIYNFINYTDGI